VAPPEFPPPFVIERTRALGFGTGPWTRDRLVQAWGAPTADKYIGEAKAAGWLVSPSRGVYHVPPAQDIMLVSWLPEPARSEFLISRTLAASNIRSWCLSAWCRDNGLTFPEPIFVTDLTPNTNAPRGQIDRRALQLNAANVAAQRNSIPFLDNLLIVPALPAIGARVPRMAMVPESSEALDRRKMETQLGQAGLGILGLIVYAIEKEVPTDLVTEFQKFEGREAAARGVPYAVDGAVTDDAWITAILASIGTSRVEELVTKKLRPAMKGRADQIQRWASLFGPPQPVASWKETLQRGPFPYLLVPPSLWSEMGADQAARRYRMLDQLLRP
jgi:hypothetical protein